MPGPQLFSPAESRNNLSPASQFGPKWYAAYTSARHEKRVAEYLQRIGVESYLALYTATRSGTRDARRLNYLFSPATYLCASHWRNACGC